MLARVLGCALLVSLPAGGASCRAAPAMETISYGPAPAQQADLRLPTGKAPFPVAIIIHGGCWRAAVSRSDTDALAEALTRRGIATLNIEYRRVGDPGGGWPGTFADIAAASDHLAAIAAAQHLDLRRVTIIGHSSGAHLALWEASRPRLPAPWSAVALHPVSVVALDGPATLAPFVGRDAQACGGPAIVPLMGGTPAQKPQDYRLASPADHLPLGVRQLLVEAVFAPIMQPYAAQARASGDTVDVLTPPGATHHDIIEPGTPNGAAVVDFIVSKAFPPPGR